MENFKKEFRKQTGTRLPMTRTMEAYATYYQRYSEWLEQQLKNCNLQNVINWVAVDIPPKVDYFYLVYDKTYGAISKALYDGEFHLVEGLEDTEITHWAHLPKPPCL